MRLRMLVVLALLCLVEFCWAQQRMLQGRIVDFDTGNPVSMATVGFVHSNVSVFSDKEGLFSLSLMALETDSLCVTMMGYESRIVSAKEFTHNEDIALRALHTELAQVVITGTGTRHKIQDAPVQTEVITSKSIEESGITNLDELMGQTFSSIDYTQSSMGNSLSINGFGSDYVLFLVDGKRLNGSIGGVIDLDRIDVSDIEQIEVVKGAASTLYGSDAIGGVINIIMKKKKSHWGLSNASFVGHHNTYNQSNTFSINRGKITSKTSVSYKQLDGWQLNYMEYNSSWNKNHDLPVLEKTHDMPVNKKRSVSVAEKVTYKATDRFELNAQGELFFKRIYFPFMGRMLNYYYDDKAVSIDGKYSFSKTNYLTTSIEYNNYQYYNEYPWKYNEEKKTYYPGDRSKNSDQSHVVANIKGVFSIGKSHKVNVGLEWIGEWLESPDRLTVAEAKSFTSAAYVQDEIELFSKLSAVFGARAIYHDQFGAMVTPKASLMAKTNHFTHRLTYAEGFKSPTVKELYYHYKSDRMGVFRLYLGNEELQAQRSTYYAYGNEYSSKTGTVKFNATAYLNRINDKIDYKIIPNLPGYQYRGVEETKMKYNIHEVQSLGIDVGTKLKLSKQLSVSGSYSWVDAMNETENIRLNGVSEHSATWSVSWLKRWNGYKLSVLLSGKYKSDKFFNEEDLRIQYAKEHQLWKFTSNHSFEVKKTKVNISTGIDNVFDFVDDSPYGSHYATLSPGRTYFASLKLFFKK